MEPYDNQGYDLYLDSFYSSPLLAMELSKVGIIATSTVPANRRGLPKEVTPKWKDPRGTVWATHYGKMLAFS